MRSATDYRCLVPDQPRNRPRPARRSSPERSRRPSKGRDADASAPPLGDAARHATFLSIARQCRRWPEFELHAFEQSVERNLARASDLDRAFAHAIYDTTVSRWLTLTYLVSRFCQRPLAELEPRVLGAMLGGACQIVFLDRVPAHAAINHAVEWTKAQCGHAPKGLVNAVLRRIADLARPDDGAPRTRPQWSGERDELPFLLNSDRLGSLVLSQPVLPEDDTERLAASTSHPVDLLRLWLKNAPLREVRSLCLHSLASPPTIINTSFAASTNPLPPELVPHDVPGHHVFRGSHDRLVALLDSRSDLWVQDPASTRAVGSVADLRPRVVLDLCAGQGTKTRQLAAAFPDAEIYATDVDDLRRATLERQFAGSGQVRVLSPRQMRERMLGKGELILLDVPCSNSGVLPRRPEARYRLTGASLASLTDIQRQIIADAIPLLSERPEGQILYSTCSLERAENHEMAAWAVKWHGFKLQREQVTRPKGLPGEPDTSYHDGSFGILLAR